MRIGLISDIHGNNSALDVVLQNLLQETDKILFLGDLCGYYPFIEACAALWDGNRITGVRGNHDQVLLDCLQDKTPPSTEYEARFGSALRRSLESLDAATLTLLQSMPSSRTLTLSGTTVALFHGAPWDPLEGRVYPDFNDWDRFLDTLADIILLGHTHYPLVKRYRGKLIVNPGSVGQPRDRAGMACYAVLELTSGAVQHHRLPFEARALIEDARRHDPDLPYLVEVLNRQ